MWVFCLPVCALSVQCLWRPGEGDGCHATRITVVCELPSKMLGIKPRPSGRAVNALRSWTISPTPQHFPKIHHFSVFFHCGMEFQHELQRGQTIFKAQQLSSVWSGLACGFVVLSFCNCVYWMNRKLPLACTACYLSLPLTGLYIVTIDKSLLSGLDFYWEQGLNIWDDVVLR